MQSSGHRGVRHSAALLVALVLGSCCATNALPDPKPGAAAALATGTAAHALVHESSHGSILADSGQLDAEHRSAVVRPTSDHARIPASWKLTPPAMKLKDAVSRGAGTASAGTYVHHDGTVTLYAVLPFDANDGGYAASVLTSNVSAALPYAPVEAHGSMGVKVHVQEDSVIHSLDTLASMSAVAAVEPRLQLTYHNAPEARIVQSDEASPSTGFDAAPF